MVLDVDNGDHTFSFLHHEGVMEDPETAVDHLAHLDLFFDDQKVRKEKIFHLFSKQRKRTTDLDEGEGFREDILDQERKGVGCHD
jgi:hypothetical protein